MNRNNRWIARNFGALMDAYGGRYVAVVDGRVVGVGVRPETAERRAARFTAAAPAVVRVPERGAGPALDPLRLFRLS